MKFHSFGTILPKTVDLADFRSLFIKANSFDMFLVDFQEIIDVFFWALLKTVEI